MLFLLPNCSYKIPPHDGGEANARPIPFTNLRTLGLESIPFPPARRKSHSGAKQRQRGPTTPVRNRVLQAVAASLDRVPPNGSRISCGLRPPQTRRTYYLPSGCRRPRLHALVRGPCRPSRFGQPSRV